MTEVWDFEHTVPFKSYNSIWRFQLLQILPIFVDSVQKIFLPTYLPS